MKNNKDIKLMWQIANFINKKHCKGKLKINRIFFYKKNRHKDCLGFYGTLKSNKKNIAIFSESDLMSKTKTLIHELAHAYLDQIANVHYTREIAKVLRKQPLQNYDKMYIKDIFIHNKEFKKIDKMFLETLDKHLKIVLK